MTEVEFDPGHLEAAIIEELADVLGGRDGLAWKSIERSHDRLRQFEDQYDVEPVIDSLDVPHEGPMSKEDERTIHLEWGWDHPAAGFFDKGTSDHTINGNPVLSFVWQDPPDWVREEFDQARSSGGRFQSGWRVFFQSVDVSGIDETRFVRHGTDWLERELVRRFR